MGSKRIFFAQKWGPSEQPNTLTVDKRALRWASAPEYFASAMMMLLATPVIAAGLLSSRPRKLQSTWSPQQFLGMSISPCPIFGAELPAIVADLGARRLMLRVPVWGRDQFIEYRRFADRFPDCDMVVSVVQDRGSVCYPEQWRADLRAIFSAFAGRVTHFQLPMVSNRTKWGCTHMGDAHDLLEIAHALRQEFPWLRLIGPGVIDFEPVPFFRGLINARRYQLDVIGSLLYVDRRGGPGQKQYNVFDLATKLRFWRAIADASPRCRNRRRTPLWITEFNWPLKNTDHWSPTSGEEQIDEETAATYLRDYCKIAYQTGLVERIYWWQLIHPGYGLIDSRGGILRKRPTYFVAQKILHGAESLSAVKTGMK